MRLFKYALVVFLITFAAAAIAQPRPGGGATPTPPAATAGGLISAYNADQLAQLANDAGFTAKVVVTKDNQRLVQIQFWPNTVSGAQGSFCKKDGGPCDAYQLVAIIPNETNIASSWTDAWNSKYYFVRSYKDGTDLVFAWDVLLNPGVSADYIKATLAVFKTIVDDSTNFKP